MPPKPLLILTITSLLLFTVTGRLISDGITNNNNGILRLNPLTEEVPSTEACEQTYGFLPCTDTAFGNLFLILVYGYLMYLAATYLSAGSELLLEILGPGLVGGLLLPILGALPDAMLILDSLCDLNSKGNNTKNSKKLSELWEINDDNDVTVEIRAQSDGDELFGDEGEVRNENGGINCANNETGENLREVGTEDVVMDVVEQVNVNFCPVPEDTECAKVHTPTVSKCGLCVTDNRSSYVKVVTKNASILNNKLEYVPTVISEKEPMDGKWETIVGAKMGSCYVYKKSDPYEISIVNGTSTLSSRLGRLVVMDQMTASNCNHGTGRLGYARVHVEIDATKGFTDKIEIVYKNAKNNVKS
ncbi:hypothetical protein CTI12_AA211190 [Artemisia annua]|uniref:Uncharacterized protein n=1 Tax=Artemisia annua TaxID=35608 RepID=A0A2U1NZA8_ARTAN|nr:hypothetical protein CTI12_AA211190 [Artemisia annua]